MIRDESIIPEQKETAVPSHQPSTLAPAPARTVSIIPQSSTPAYIPKKKFAYLLRTEIYHKLSIVNLPPAFREEFYIVSARDSLESLLSKLESYLATGRLLHAAHLSASILTSSVINPTDYTTIFALFYIRLACLDLTGHTMIAAQESKALEDLSSEFYFIDTTDELHEKTEFDVDENNGNKYKDHIAPWQLRVLAVRLQSLGFNDARRGIAGLYDLGFYARNQLSHKKLSKEDVQLWKTRLADLGIRVVNSLIEMGDMETARRTLAGLGPADSNQHKMRMAMLYLHTGDVRAAESVIGGIHDDSKEILKCLLIMAEGNYIEAIAAWEDYLQSHPGKDDEGLILQNLAVCMLFTGRLNEVGLIESSIC